jgi:hypothetical protein
MSFSVLLRAVPRCPSEDSSPPPFLSIFEKYENTNGAPATGPKEATMKGTQFFVPLAALTLGAFVSSVADAQLEQTDGNGRTPLPSF